MNARLLVQQRMRRSQSSIKVEGAATRVSPIREEANSQASPPSLDQLTLQPSGPARTASNLSSESTESTQSQRTVRASKPGTPMANAPLRTPSYPFPYVPGTPKIWSSGFHQPFIALSPTASGTPTRDETPGATRTMYSGDSTPAQSASEFMPPNAAFPASEDPRFPAPNLYDLVLQLNAEPGLEQWWATVTNIMHDHYKASRVTLVMPMDPTDIENVPWGQKAAFSMNGVEEFVPHPTILEQTAMAKVGLDRGSNVDRGSIAGDQVRPRLEARHSYAGDGREAPMQSPAKPTRPQGPPRTKTHAAGVTGANERHRLSGLRFPSVSSMRHGSMDDAAFSSIAGDYDSSPYAEIFRALRPLDDEVRPLIEPRGVNRVLERGKVVTVTRDYGPEGANIGERPASSSTRDISTSEPTNEKSFAERMFGNYRSVFTTDRLPPLTRDYEEYEQYPSSPWSQSPAPSPAIQADEDANPFFTSTTRSVEDSFDPVTTPKDYSQLGQVEAIGVDRASTIIHIPLIHISLSQPMQSLKIYTSPASRPNHPKRSNTVDLERRAPIAILSILTSTVPYPQNLTQSLKLLGPHLATSFAVSQQFSSTGTQSVTIRHRRTASGRVFSTAPMQIEPTSLADIVTSDVRHGSGSNSGSVTSPSEYSSRSRHSPGSSIVGTPGWDPASHYWTNRSVAGTPGMTGAEMVDNYFDAKKRPGQRNPSNADAQVHTPGRPVRKTPSTEGKRSARKPSPASEDEVNVSHSRTASKSTRPTKDERSALVHADQEKNLPRSSQYAQLQRPGSRRSITQPVGSDARGKHSQLHSYGADFEASFGAVAGPAAEPETPYGFTQGRRTSQQEDIPPPSERLLRTIIDSVPVQIFTAEPETGRLTWVNQKFMIYRGQEARQVLSEPWQAIHPDDLKEFMTTWQRSLRTTQQLQQKVRLERFDGSYRWFYVRAAPLKDKRQKIVHWIGTLMDFHEQHIAEVNSARQHETAASEAKYRALANSSPQIVFAVSKVKGVIFCNTQWVHFSGQSEAHALGVGFMDHVHPDDLAKCRLPTFEEGTDIANNVPQSMPPDLLRNPSATSSSGSSETEKGHSSPDSTPMGAQLPQRKLSELATTGILKASRDADGRPSYSTEVRLKSKDGEYRWHLVRVLLAEPLGQHDTDEETWYGTCTDINDHKMLERDLKETMDEKSRFLSNMSHEIRTPLNGITGMVNFLIDSSLTTEQLEHVNIIRSSTEGLRGLINDILDLSKAEAGMIQLNMDWLYVRALIEEVNDLTSTMAIDKGLELNYLVEEDVPSQTKGDRFRIRQILLNIVGNAIKFTQKGEVFIRCSLPKSSQPELAKNEVYIRFDVMDTGQSFSDKEAEYLFKRFSQVDGSSTRQHGGTGLGLVISRQLAQLHGGDMSAKGSPGKGSTFTFYIKATLPTQNNKPPPPPATPGIVNIPILPLPPGPGSIPSPTTVSKMSKAAAASFAGDNQPRPSPKFALEHTETPSPYAAPSPSTSSASSDPSVRSAARTSSLRSERSSASSFVPDPSMSTAPPMKLALPTGPRRSTAELEAARSTSIDGPARSLSPGEHVFPPMFSILVLCPLAYSREATVQHITKTLPKNIPSQITARESLSECRDMIGGDDPVIFTHIVVVLQDIDEIVALVRLVLTTPSYQGTEIVVITDLAQRRNIIEKTPSLNYEQLAQQRRLRFVFKPLKPSRFASIFDPQKEREMSTDRNQDSAQQVAWTQKQVFENLTSKLGNRGKRVLLVEDNRTNQLVSVSIPIYCYICSQD